MALEEKMPLEEAETPAVQNAICTKEEFRDRMVAVLALLHDFEEDVAVRLMRGMQAAVQEEEEQKLLTELLQKAELFQYDEAQEQIEAYLGKA